MSDTLEYKGFVGTVEYSAEDHCLYGKVLGTRDLIMYEGESILELEKDFQETIDEYIEDCKELGKEPHTSYKGNFSVRISPEKHRLAAMYAQRTNISLNKFVDEAITRMLKEG